MADERGRNFGSCRFYFYVLLRLMPAFRLIVTALLCLPTSVARAQMPQPGGWNGSVALPAAPMAPAYAPPSLNHFAPLPHAGMPPSRSFPTGSDAPYAGDYSSPLPQTDRYEQDWAAFEQSERAIARQMGRR
ncbi:hypothetical protein B0W47_00210 [Komagataeibacter nataicola]|uniref:Uncharacterized protein n=2 Tax=Komagataeibacter nataicola TaxID=265960 RepID=A0A9N7GZL7_9PROT|nr:hypothetical protein B0W47_00210 [Komagataeibacter nataicola]PYD67345.1 hypothetical protein CDI09_03780 [Komagataeibacter nataicola]